MSSKPIFVATHPRACSTAFERVFMQRRDILTCVHEPFGEAFYYGPERLSTRFENDPDTREKSGCANETYKDVVDRLEKSEKETGKRTFIKDIIYYIVPHSGEAHIAPSLQGNDANVKGSAKPGTESVNGVNGGGEGEEGGKVNGSVPEEEKGNPTVLPTSLLRKFHFTFLIRHPRRAVPSYYRCTVPPLDEVTGFDHFMPSEAGYVELRRLFDYVKEKGIIGPARAGEKVRGEGEGEVTITVVDADDLLDRPAEVIEAFCKEVGIDYTPDMLRWDDKESQEYAVKTFEKWNGFHNDVIGSTYLKPREHGVKNVTEEQEDEEWRKKYGDEAQKVIRECVNENIPHYEYLKSFALKF
ncbi:P-loop containing nucleoside triphosphate hydrolase protein [Coniochaeta sp. 2T2.1]|nr:P-loop containing nucleoside triphosphate hydrolase protein [Coniochaeta sp. 2T2.1]